MKIAIADDKAVYRESLERSLRAAGVDVPICVSSGDELRVNLRRTPVDVAIIDVKMPEGDVNGGVTTARAVRDSHPSVGILLLSAYAATRQTVQLLRTFDTGVGFLQKDDAIEVDDLVVSLKRIMDGEIVVRSDMIKRLMGKSESERKLESLSQRERDVLSLVAKGYSNASIGGRLNLSMRAVEDHIANVFRKLNLREGNKRVLAVLEYLRLTDERDSG